jgi:hypothetical protein
MTATRPYESPESNGEGVGSGRFWGVDRAQRRPIHQNTGRSLQGRPPALPPPFVGRARPAIIDRAGFGVKNGHRGEFGHSCLRRLAGRLAVAADDKFADLMNHRVVGVVIRVLGLRRGCGDGSRLRGPPAGQDRHQRQEEHPRAACRDRILVLASCLDPIGRAPPAYTAIARPNVGRLMPMPVRSKSSAHRRGISV